MWTLGVDPGAKGALALVDPDGHLVEVWDMPVVDKEVNGPLLDRAIVRALDLSHSSDRSSIQAWVERAQAMPGQGVSSMFRYGRGYGVVLGVLASRQIAVHHLSAAAWKRAAGLSRDKGASRRRATDLWPAEAELFRRVKDDGRAEAALIARHGWASQRTEAA